MKKILKTFYSTITKSNVAKNVILVGSGKGGVGKSTITSNLALSMSEYKNNLSFGILDADIYGPSICHSFDLSSDVGVETIDEKNYFVPIEKYGLKILSVGSLLDDDTPLIWRGPIVNGVINQLLFDTNWGDLDVLFVDLPPGTGDVAISICQQVDVQGAIIVSTPQEISLLDVKKAVTMFEKFEIPIFGMVENMSYFECPNCNERSHIFGKGGVKKYAEEKNIELLAEIPHNMTIMENMDKGVPSALQVDVNKEFIELSEKIWKILEDE